MTKKDNEYFKNSTNCWICGNDYVFMDLQIYVTTTGLEKYTTFTINNNFIDSFHFLSSSLYILVKNLGKNDLNYLNQEFDNNLLDLVRSKDFILISI